MNRKQSIEYEKKRDPFLNEAEYEFCHGSDYKELKSSEDALMGVLHFLKDDPFDKQWGENIIQGYNWARDNYYTYFPPEEGEDVMYNDEVFKVDWVGLSGKTVNLRNANTAWLNISLSELRPIDHD